jgi:hypothetical protein
MGIYTQVNQGKKRQKKKKRDQSIWKNMQRNW